MRIIHDVHFSRQEIEGYRQLIFANLVLGMGAVLMAMEEFQMKLSPSNMVRALCYFGSTVLI